MESQFIDLRSDTVTKPTAAMKASMLEAVVGDDVYGEDPTVKELERRLVSMFGKEEALFFPTGTMANQAAIKLHTQPGEQLIADAYAHVYNYEGGGVSFNSGVSCKLIAGHRGMITADQVRDAINPPDFYHSPLTRLVCLENTTNKGGGACYDLDEIRRIHNVCQDHNLGLHLDGARLWNALVATQTSPEEIGKPFDTISVCLSKGLGTPLGSVLMGTAEIMKNALRVRKVLGGGMRQIGYIAAAGLYALDHHIQRLEEDHRRATEIGNALRKTDFVKQVEPIDTNIIIFTVHGDEQEVVEQFANRNIHFFGMGSGKLRMVTHLDYTESMHEKVLETITSLRIKCEA